MQESEYIARAKRRKIKCALLFYSLKQLKRTIMGGKVCRVQKGSNTKIAKSLLFIDIESQHYIIGNKLLERVNSPVEETLGSDTEGKSQHSKEGSIQSLAHFHLHVVVG